MAYNQALNLAANNPDAFRKAWGLPGTISLTQQYIAQLVNQKYGVNIDYAKLGPALGVTPAPPPAAGGLAKPGLTTIGGAPQTGFAVGQKKPVDAAGKAPGQKPRPLSALGLAIHEATTGDIHRPALVGDKEGVVNANAMAAGGAEIVRQLNELFPAANGTVRTPGQASYAGGYSPLPAEAAPSSPSQTPVPTAPAVGSLAPSSAAPQAPQAPGEAPDRESVFANLVAKGTEELAVKAPPKPLTTAEASKWAQTAADARAAYDALAQGASPDPGQLAQILNASAQAARDGRIQRISNESAAWAARVLKGATAEELAFLGGDFAKAADARLSKENLQSELATRLKIAQMQIDAQAGGAASPLTYAFEMAKMILGDSVGKMDGKSILKKRASDKLYNAAYNVWQTVLGGQATNVSAPGWLGIGGLKETPSTNPLDPLMSVPDKGAAGGAAGPASGSYSAQAPTDPRAFLAAAGATRTTQKP